jgi:apolipoprotein N-acyltransferase
LGDARRTGAFFAGFFLTVVVFLWLVALTDVFFRFALVLPLAFFLAAIYSLP